MKPPQPPTILIAIDPSLTCTGIVAALRDPMVAKSQWLEHVAVVRTKALDTLPDRLAQLHDGIGRAVESMVRSIHARMLDPNEPFNPMPIKFIIESPATHGVYSERRERQHGKAGINAKAMYLYAAASGVAIQAAHNLSNGRVCMLPAARVKKEQRRLMVTRIFSDEGLTRPEAKLLHMNDDVVDAAFLILQHTN